MCKIGEIVFGRIGSRCQILRVSASAGKVYGQTFFLELWTKYHEKTSDNNDTFITNERMLFAQFLFII
jgi:hypothetical protein